MTAKTNQYRLTSIGGDIPSLGDAQHYSKVTQVDDQLQTSRPREKTLERLGSNDPAVGTRFEQMSAYNIRGDPQDDGDAKEVDVVPPVLGVGLYVDEHDPERDCGNDIDTRQGCIGTPGESDGWLKKERQRRNVGSHPHLSQFLQTGRLFWPPSGKSTRYPFEVPRQARGTHLQAHLVRCFSRFSAAHSEIFLGIMVEEMWCRLCRWLALWVYLSTFAPMAARSSRQLSLARHITRDHDGLWKDVRRTERAPKRHNLPMGLFSLTLPGLVVTACAWENYIGFAVRSPAYSVVTKLASSAVTSHKTHCLIGPPSTTLPGPDTTDWHPFYGRLVVAGHTITTSMMSGRASCQRSGLSSDSQHSVTGRRMNLRSPRQAFAPGYCPHQWTLSPILSCRGYTRATRVSRAALIEWVSRPHRCSHDIHGIRRRMQYKLGVTFLRSTNVEVRELVAVYLALANTVADYSSPSVSEDDGDRPREYAVFCVVYDWAFSKGFSNSPSHCGFGAITTIGSGEEMESENGKRKFEERPPFGQASSFQTAYYVLFPSVRACRTRGFPSTPRFPRQNLAFVHVMQSSLKVSQLHQENKTLLGALAVTSADYGCLRFGPEPTASSQAPHSSNMLVKVPALGVIGVKGYRLVSTYKYLVDLGTDW
ncbi:hypothetical protein H4582DRAFT_2063614 [Lactarius indigo]|nr:hypothetical protein H4582DRAFT_2063614 [Lactarius indigo]